ncbi:uncharacterized protein [Anser cygnoides]|uniref:uncharacterized protein n=1 Tax=Anser cygnoides TaxID=8845 RepID=UPI0034D2A335
MQHSQQSPWPLNTTFRWRRENNIYRHGNVFTLLQDADGSLLASFQGKYCCIVLALSNILSVLVMGALKGLGRRDVMLPLHIRLSVLADLVYLLCRLDHPKSTILAENSFSQCTAFPCNYGIKLHCSEEARLSFLTATALRHSQHSLLFPPFTWAAAAVSAAAGAAAVSLPVLHPGLADLRLTRLHIAKEEERWSHIFFYFCLTSLFF